MSICCHDTSRSQNQNCHSVTDTEPYITGVDKARKKREWERAREESEREEGKR